MTILKKTIYRLLPTFGPWFRKSGGVVVELTPPNLIVLRERGRRTRYEINADSLLLYLIKKDKEMKESERKRRRKPAVKRGLLGRL